MTVRHWMVLCVCVLCLAPWAQGGASEIDHTLQGPAFVPGKPNPALVTPDWIAKGITHPASAGPVDLIVEMDQNLYDALTPIIERYGKENKLAIRINKGTCGTSSGPLSKKEADMAGFCCPPAPFDRLPGIVFHTIGIVPTVFIVHPSNPLTDIRFAEVQQLFNGTIHDWNELADPKAKSVNGAIQPVARLHCETRPGHWRDILDNKNMFQQQTHFTSSIPDMVDYVATSPLAIGWVSRWVVELPANKGRVKVLHLDGVDADDAKAVAAGRYPYYKVMNVSTWTGAAANPRADRLVETLLNHPDQLGNAAFIAHAKDLRQNGWRFDGNELIGKPQ
ncbi:MAG: hypothetical protein HQL78_03995 [Magnetococcales bacterium]|nr:hypothetical protein [Magnetococcales bacterium]